MLKVRLLDYDDYLNFRIPILMKMLDKSSRIAV